MFSFACSDIISENTYNVFSLHDVVKLGGVFGQI